MRLLAERIERRCRGTEDLTLRVLPARLREAQIQKELYEHLV
jgi:hypothetical protein